MTGELPGIDLPAVRRWVSAVLPQAVAPLTLTRVGDGRSNLTYRVDDGAGHRWVVRRPPVGPRLPSAHDMAREHRLIAALGPAGVPVPEALGLCEDETVTGAPFYLMEHVDGIVITDRDDALAVPAAVREHAGPAAIEALVSLHEVDVERAGLADLARHGSYAERQLRRWLAQWKASSLDQRPEIEQAHALLSAAIPPQRTTGIVHGDYKLENLVLDRAGDVRAILDWELCTLGDPLADLGLLLVYWSEPGDDLRIGLGPKSPTRAPGFATREELVAAYARRSGGNLDGLPFFRALGAWKLAIIVEGVRRRFRDDPANANVGAAELEERAAALTDQALALATALG